MSREILDRHQVQIAELGNLSHPIISVLDENWKQIIEVNAGYKLIKSDREKQVSYIKNNYEFLADAFVKAGPFTLTPIDIIAIWAKAIQVFALRPRYRLSSMISSAYAIQGVTEFSSNPEWVSLPRIYLTELRIPTDLVGLRYVNSRLDHVSQSLRKIEGYIDHLPRAERETNPILGQIIENFGNGLGALYLSVNATLKKVDS